MESKEPQNIDSPDAAFKKVREAALSEIANSGKENYATNPQKSLDEALALLDIALQSGHAPLEAIPYFTDRGVNDATAITIVFAWERIQNSRTPGGRTEH